LKNLKSILKYSKTTALVDINMHVYINIHAYINIHVYINIHLYSGTL